MAKPKKKTVKKASKPAAKKAPKSAAKKAPKAAAKKAPKAAAKKAPKAAAKKAPKAAAKKAPKSAAKKAPKAAAKKAPKAAAKKSSSSSRAAPAPRKFTNASPIRKPAPAKRPAPNAKRGVNENVLNQTRAKIFAREIEENPRTRERAFIGADGKGKDDMANEMGRDFLIAAETGKEVLEELSDEEEEEESGGPFTPSSGRKEFAGGTDESNPEDAEREPFPKTSRS